MNIDLWLFYVLVVFTASIIPGPSMILALSNGAKYGAKKTLFSAMGNVAASLFQALLSLLSLSAILHISNSFFILVKWFGIAYLIYLGISMVRCQTSFLTASTGYTDRKDISGLSMFWQACSVALANPKAIVFFTALFPQFFPSSTAISAEWCAVMLITLGILAFVCFMLYAIGGEYVLRFCKTSFLSRYGNRIVGFIFITTGLGMIMENK